MVEKKLRARIAGICQDLDERRTRRLGARAAFVPLVVGAGFFALTCSDETDTGNEAPYMAPTGWDPPTTTSSSSLGGQGGIGGDVSTGGEAGAGGQGAQGGAAGHGGAAGAGG